MNPFYTGYDEFGNPISIQPCTQEEHMAMHQRMYGTSGYGRVPLYSQYTNVVPGQQAIFSGQMGMCQQQGYQRATTKKDILGYIQSYICPSEMEQVTEFDTKRTRHICKGIKGIVLLDKQVIQVPANSGFVCVEVFFCPRCRKLLVNSQSLEVL